ncbi:hypothetical protein NEAUS05_0301 [Nematocida ausubeli]|nr:hypothetical protein NEAUS07_0636 [Nematocida ausubeli]KAI5146965.1 hypothetical protein NEAUS05_0301 [Nematocida ausubeli]
MQWDRFVKKEVHYEKDNWPIGREKEYLDRISVDDKNDWYFEVNGVKHLLPIQNIVRVTKAQDTTEEYLINNKSVGIVLKPSGRIRKFFRIPSVTPESLTYFGNSLVAGLSHSKEEVVSFTVGGVNSDSEFSITNMGVAIRLENCTEMSADENGLYVLHDSGICTLFPAEF